MHVSQHWLVQQQQYSCPAADSNSTDVAEAITAGQHRIHAACAAITLQKSEESSIKSDTPAHSSHFFGEETLHAV